MSGKKKPVILFLNHWARRMGGAEHSLIDILSGIHDTCDCHIATSESGPLIEKVKQLSVTCHVVPCNAPLDNIRRWNLLKTLLFSWKDIGAFFMFVIRLKKVVDHITPDLIHANVPKSHVALFLLRLMGFQGSCCFHVREIFKHNSAALGLYTVLFPKKKGCIISISHAVKHHLPHSLQSKTSVIYNGVYCTPSSKEYCTGGRIKLLYLGRIVPWKGCHILIDIFNSLIKQYPQKELSLSLVGDTLYWSDDYRRTVSQKIVDYNLSSCCHLLPHSDNPESVFMAHDIFCNASDNEPFGRVIAEAQGCGLPVVAFHSGGVPEIVTHNETGLLVPPRSTERFVDALSFFITNPDSIKNMGLKGRERIDRFFNKDTQIPLIGSFLKNQIL